MIEITKEMAQAITKFGDQASSHLVYDFRADRSEVHEQDKQAMIKMIESGYKMGVIACTRFILNDPNAHMFRTAIIDNAFEKAD